MKGKPAKSAGKSFYLGLCPKPREPRRLDRRPAVQDERERNDEETNGSEKPGGWQGH